MMLFWPKLNAMLTWSFAVRVPTSDFCGLIINSWKFWKCASRIHPQWGLRTLPTFSLQFQCAGPSHSTKQNRMPATQWNKVVYVLLNWFLFHISRFISLLTHFLKEKKCLKKNFFYICVCEYVHILCCVYQQHAYLNYKAETSCVMFVKSCITLQM